MKIFTTSNLPVAFDNLNNNIKNISRATPIPLILAQRKA